MATINLEIDSKLATILEFLQYEYPLLAEVDLIKVAVGDFYKKLQLKRQKEQIDALPTLELTPEQTEELEKTLEESAASGFEKWDRNEFLKETSS